MIYLDNAASVPMPNDVLEYYTNQCKNNFANASAKHKLGNDAKNSIDNSRKLLLRNLKASQQYKLIFTAAATESNNLAINSIGLKAQKYLSHNQASQVTIYHQVGDHASLVQPILHLNRGITFTLKEIPTLMDMRIDATTWISQLQNLEKKTLIIVITSHGHNVTGNIVDFTILAKLKNQFMDNIYIHLDFSQSFTKIPIDLSSGDIDSLTISSHKIGGPKGSAALIYRNSLQVEPMLWGGNHEEGLRSSTYNSEAINTMSYCASLRISRLKENYDHVQNLQQKTREILSNELKENFQELFNRKSEYNLPYIFVFAVKDISSDIIMRHLEIRNIIIASSSACSSKNKKPQQLFEKMGVAKDFSKGVIRCSFSPENTLQQVEEFGQVFIEVYLELKKM